MQVQTLLYVPVGMTGAQTIKAQMRATMALRHTAERFSRVPRLTRQQELEAIERFRAEKGITICPAAYAAPVVGT
jgi:hypothetical protein